MPADLFRESLASRIGDFSQQPSDWLLASAGSCERKAAEVGPTADSYIFFKCKARDWFAAALIQEGLGL